MKPLQVTHSEGVQPRDHTLPTQTLLAHMEAKCTVTLSSLQLTNHVETHRKPQLAAKYWSRLI